jgi:hypothetical protein
LSEIFLSIGLFFSVFFIILLLSANYNSFNYRSSSYLALPDLTHLF